MKRYLALLAVLLLPLIGAMWWQTKHPSLPSRSDLTVEFVCLTNDPVAAMEPVRVEVVNGTTGLHALFRVKNVNPDKSINFRTLGIEQETAQGWVPYAPTNSWHGVGGDGWDPNYCCLYAIQWPPGLATNTAWRMQLNVEQDISNFRERINLLIHFPVFRPHVGGFTTSSAVRP